MHRRLTTILAAKVVTYGRLMGLDEAGTHAAWKAHRQELIDAKIGEYQGRIVKHTGDGFLADFPSIVNAVACAATIQQGMRVRNVSVPQERRIEFRMGINLGDVIVEPEDIYGDGVNVAARLENIAKPGGIVISATVRDNVGNRLDLQFEDMGEQMLKNIDRPVRAYSVVLERAQRPRRATALGDRETVHCGAPLQQYEWRPRAGIFQRWDHRGHHHRPVEDLRPVRHCAQHDVHLQRQAGEGPTGRQDLRVKFILEGSVRKAGPRVRVTAQLIEGQDGGHVWADRYDRDLTDIFAIQDEITHTIVDQLKVKLLPEEKRP